MQARESALYTDLSSSSRDERSARGVQERSRGEWIRDLVGDIYQSFVRGASRCLARLRGYCVVVSSDS